MALRGLSIGSLTLYLTEAKGFLYLKSTQIKRINHSYAFGVC